MKYPLGWSSTGCTLGCENDSSVKTEKPLLVWIKKMLRNRSRHLLTGYVMYQAVGKISRILKFTLKTRYTKRVRPIMLKVHTFLMVLPNLTDNFIDKRLYCGNNSINFSSTISAICCLSFLSFFTSCWFNINISRTGKQNLLFAYVLPDLFTAFVYKMSTDKTFLLVYSEMQLCQTHGY